MTCGIYKITNNITQESYVGQSVNIEKRFSEHKKAKDNYAIHRAIQKYGEDNFTYEIIEECKRENLSEREKYWINYYNTYYNGYNETKGGEGATEANKIKINQYSLAGKYIKTFDSITEAIIELGKNYVGSQISTVCKGNRKTAYNFQWRYEKDFPDKKDIEPVQVVDKTRKEICQYDKNNVFIKKYKNITAASKETNIGRTSISNCLNGYAKSAGGYIWKKSL